VLSAEFQAAPVGHVHEVEPILFVELEPPPQALQYKGLVSSIKLYFVLLPAADVDVSGGTSGGVNPARGYANLLLVMRTSATWKIGPLSIK
jgi:hypothetical protein